MSLKTREKPNFCGVISWDFAGISGAAGKVRKREVCVQFGPLILSNSERPHSLRARPHKGVTLIMVGFFHYQSNHQDQAVYERGAHSNGKMHFFLATIADGKQQLHGEKGRKTQKRTLTPILDEASKWGECLGQPYMPLHNQGTLPLQQQELHTHKKSINNFFVITQYS